MLPRSGRASDFVLLLYETVTAITSEYSPTNSSPSRYRIDGIVGDYLVDLRTPPDDARCSL